MPLLPILNRVRYYVPPSGEMLVKYPAIQQPFSFVRALSPVFNEP